MTDPGLSSDNATALFTAVPSAGRVAAVIASLLGTEDWAAALSLVACPLFFSHEIW
jgi:hypothetical protein